MENTYPGSQQIETQGRKLTEEERTFFKLPNTNPTDDVVVSSTENEVSPIYTSPSSEELSQFGTSHKVWRLADGSLKVLGPGRPPKGAVCVFAPTAAPRTARAPKAQVMLRLVDGSIKPRGKGRPPKGSVVIKVEGSGIDHQDYGYPNTPPENE